MMIVQKHAHLDGSMAYMRFKSGSYHVSLEKSNPAGNTVYLKIDHFQNHKEAHEWMEKQRKIRRD